MSKAMFVFYIVSDRFCVHRAKFRGCDRTLWSTKPRLFTVWLFTEKKFGNSASETYGGVYWPNHLLNVHLLIFNVKNADKCRKGIRMIDSF